MALPTKNLPFEYTQRWAEVGGLLAPDATAETINLLNKRDKDLEDYLANLPAGGAGRPYATYVVAAPNSQHPDAANADFQGGYAAIQAAVDALSSTIGGMVLLLDGEFLYPSGAFVEFINKSNVTIAGMGASTQLVGDAGSGPAIIADTCYRPSIRDLAIGGTISDGIQMTSCESPMISGCWIGDSIGDITNYGILLTANDYAIITGNKLYGCDVGIYTENDNHYLIESNALEEIVTAGMDMGDSTGSNSAINANIIHGPTDSIILRTGLDDVSITSNLLHGSTNGIAVGTGCDRILAANNTMRSVTNYFTGAGTANKGAGNYLDGTWTP